MLTMSAVVPTYNSERHLGEVIDALKGQVIPFKDIIVVDDASTDRSRNVAEAKGVRVISLEENLGVAAARNIGIEAADSDLVACIDSDVALHSDWSSLLLPEIKDEVILAGGRLIEKHQLAAPDRWRALHMPQDHGDMRRVFDGQRDGRLSGFALLGVRREIERLGGFDARFGRSFEDVDLSQRAIKSGARLAYNPDALAYHLRKDSCLSVLRSSWSWDHWPEVHDGSYDTVGGIARKCLKNARWLFELSFQHWRAGEHSLLKVDLALGALFTAWDVRYYLYRRHPLFRKMLTGADLGNDKSAKSSVSRVLRLDSNGSR